MLDSTSTLRIAVNHRRKNQQTGEWVEEPNYFDVNVFGSQAENSARFLSKGRPVGVDGRLRSAVTMAVVGVLALVVTQVLGGLRLPHTAPGWWGLAMLTVLYGTAFTFMFTLLPRLGVVGSSPILNVEPVAAMVLAWALLDQRIAPVQVLGALVVVATVMVLGLKKR